jgi:hypothetical protein
LDLQKKAAKYLIIRHCEVVLWQQIGAFGWCTVDRAYNSAFLVHNGIERGHKMCDIVIVKLTYMSIFIIIATSFEDSNMFPFFVFNRLRVMEELRCK